MILRIFWGYFHACRKSMSNTSAEMKVLPKVYWMDPELLIYVVLEDRKYISLLQNFFWPTKSLVSFNASLLIKKFKFLILCESCVHVLGTTYILYVSWGQCFMYIKVSFFMGLYIMKAWRVWTCNWETSFCWHVACMMSIDVWTGLRCEYGPRAPTKHSYTRNY